MNCRDFLLPKCAVQSELASFSWQNLHLFAQVVLHNALQGLSQSHARSCVGYSTKPECSVAWHTVTLMLELTTLFYIYCLLQMSWL